MKVLRYSSRPIIRYLVFGATWLLSLSVLQAQVDPGPRPLATRTATTTNPKFATFSFTRTIEPRDALGADGAGAILTGSGNLAAFWGQSIAAFANDATVAGGPNNILGLGPAFNGTSCQQCHSFPTIGGTSGPVNFQADPAFVHAQGAANPVNLQGFISQNGPVREVRFIVDPATGLTDGGVHELFSIQGRSDAPAGCVLSQPDFPTQLANNNLIFRIPTPTFGLGFVENTPEATLRSNLANAQTLSAMFVPNLDIQGHFNTNGNDGTITRFGWKAQNKSLLLFSGEAGNVEVGMTNEIFPTEKVPGSGCAPNNLPEDITVILAPGDPLLTPPITPALLTAKISNLIETFAVFMRLNGAPGQCAFNSPSGACFSLTATGGADGQNNADAVASIQRGRALFGSVVPVGGGPANPGIGCAVCHTDVLTTGPSTAPGLSNQQFRPFSDFALHAMDSSLADGVTQGAAQPNEFRTAPLWGIGQRLFFLHDGRATDLLTAIFDHAPGATDRINKCKKESGEACQTIVNFNQLPGVTPPGTTTPSQQDLLNFLRSL